MAKEEGEKGVRDEKGRDEKGRDEKGSEAYSNPVLLFRSPVGSFFGRPTARSALSTPSRLAVCSVHCSSPYGRPRSRACRTAATSFSVWGSLTRWTQSWGRATGHAASM